MEAVEDRVVSKQAVPKGRLRITMPPEMGHLYHERCDCRFHEDVPPDSN